MYSRAVKFLGGAWLLGVMIMASSPPTSVLGQEQTPTEVREAASGDERNREEATVPAVEVAQKPLTSEEKNIRAIRSLLASIGAVEKEIESLRAEAELAETDSEKAEIRVELEAKNEQFEQLTQNLSVVATGINGESYEEMTGFSADLASELEDFLRPIVGQLKELTAKPREMEDLRSEVSHYQDQIVKAKQGLEHLDVLLASAEEEGVVDLLKSLRILWTKRLEMAENDLSVAEFKLDEAQGNQSSIFASAREAVASFFRNRGRNFITAIFAFVGVWFGVRLLYRWVIRISPFHRKKGRNFYVRLVDIGVQVVALLMGVFATTLVLYAASDWVLLGLLIIFLAGLAWTGKRALPHVYEQTKLMLNLGSVREGERVIVDGIPWAVKRINVYTDLVNPALMGGALRLPVGVLVDLHSRPFEPKEAWFPTAEGDWVVLSDETYGRVIRQTPDWVTLIELGGARKVYPITEFLSLAPKNLSLNYRVKVTFGIDYQHQAISTTEVPRLFKERLMSDLIGLVELEEIIHIGVEFEQAGPSSLDYAILADFAGSAGPKRRKLQRAIQRICVDVCNEQGWVIPFTQITLHQAPSPEAEKPAQEETEAETDAPNQSGQETMRP